MLCDSIALYYAIINCIAIYCSLLYCNVLRVLYCNLLQVLYCNVLLCTIVQFTKVYYNIPHFAVKCTVQRCISSQYTVLYCNAPHILNLNEGLKNCRFNGICQISLDTSLPRWSVANRKCCILIKYYCIPYLQKEWNSLIFFVFFHS